VTPSRTLELAIDEAAQLIKRYAWSWPQLVIDCRLKHGNDGCFSAEDFRPN
jgi:hypothetical protein